MRAVTTIVTACLLGAVTAAPATARAGNQPPTQTLIPVRISGQLTVQFRGDTAAGCARWGLCGYSGTVSWRPEASGTLAVDEPGGRHAGASAGVILAGSPSATIAGGVTTASVQLATGPSAASTTHCADATNTGVGATFPVHAGRVTIALQRASPPLLVTRCAGPRDADVIPRLPAPTLPLAAIARGRSTISLAASHTLKAHGFTGTIVSTLVLHLGRPAPVRRSGSSGSGKTQRVREIDVRYRADVSGAVVEEVRGAADPQSCGPLGTCGLAGTVTLTPRLHGGQLVVSAEEPATKPERTLLAAVGLARGPADGANAFGVLAWNRGGGILADLSQGAEDCHDADTLGLGTMLMVTAHGQWDVEYAPGAILGGAAADTRCPGPLVSLAPVAAGTAPLTSLGRRTVEMTLTIGSSGVDDGYVERSMPDLTLTLTRVSVRTSIIRIPADTFPFRSTRIR